MFSRSNHRLDPQYVCGAYQRRGLKACTSHQIRVDKLDELLKRYIKRVADNAAGIMEELTATIQTQPQREQEVGNAIDTLHQQLETAQTQLKTLLKRKLVDTIGKTPEQAEIISEAYADLESELTERIAGLTHQIDDSIDLRNTLIQANRKAKTVMEVFQSILEKPNLNKRDISLIADRIIVYNDHLDIKLKADISALLQAEEEDTCENFSRGSKDIEPIIQSAAKRPDKVFTVNVINSGDPLEIFTNGEGGVVFQKYSLMGGLADFSAQLCESLHKSTGKLVTITDRDTCLSVAGGGRRELTDKSISPALAQIMEGRQIYQHQPGQPALPVSDYTERYVISTAAPILSEGDVLGCVVFLCEQDHLAVGETEYPLAQTIAGFLGRHMEA